MKRLILFTTVSAFLAISCSNSNRKRSDNSDKEIALKNYSIKSYENMITQKITPCIWVETTNAKEVVDYYLSIFKDGKMKEYHQYKNPPEAGGGSFETAIIEIAGMELSILAAGPFFKFNESVSFVINTKDQNETDYYWTALTSNGGEESSCGWCKDKYGLSWQIVPVEYFDLINSDDPKVRDKAIKNTLKQKKIILSELK